jgi:hypothetical protein
LACSGFADTAVEIRSHLASEYGETVGAETVRNILRRQGMKAAVKVKKPLLSPQNIRKRKAFAAKYLHWTEDDWRRVVFSDETKVNRTGSDGRCWIWKKKKDTIQDREVRGTLKYGGGHIMMWGCMTHRGVGYSCRIDGNMNAQVYTSILDGELLRTLDHFGMDKGQVVFQQDNAPTHTSRLAKNWFQRNDLEVLDWPPQSPDLNPIEHLWGHLKRRLCRHETIPKGVHELWVRIQDEWNAIPPEVCEELIRSMPSRVAAVHKVKGRYTKY